MSVTQGTTSIVQGAKAKKPNNLEACVKCLEFWQRLSLKRQREEAAADRLFNILPSEQAIELRELWEEFELCSTAASRYANALDRLQPMMLNYMSHGRGWAAHGVHSSQVFAINKVMVKGSPALWNFASSCVDDAVKEGFLPK